MTNEAGGAGPRRGFNYQDIAAAYFFVTDKPEFIDKRPLELHIEEFDSDFAYYIRLDEHNVEHFFEVKYRESGEMKLSEFYGILSDFSKIANKHADSDNTTAYHLVTNASFGVKLNSLFKDTKKLRRNIRDWPQIRDKTIYQRRGTNQLEDNTQLEDDSSLAILVRGIYGHHKTEGQLKQSLEDFVRECNSPGNFRKPTQLILRTIGEKDSGVIRRETLEEVSDASLTKRSDSTGSSDHKSMDELADELQSMANDFSTPSVDTQGLHQKRQTSIEFTERMLDRDDIPTEIAESQGAGIEQDLGRLIDIKEEEEQLKYGLSKKAERFTDLADAGSTDNEEEGEEI